MVWFLMVSLLVATDQILKALIVANLSPDRSLPVIQGFLYLVNRTNRGGAWSLLADFEWGLILLIVVSGIASIVLAVLLVRWRVTPLRICMAVILAGSVGNLIDRVFQRGVTDYLSFHFWAYEFPTFNFADMMIVCGTIAMILFLLIHPDWLSSDREDGRRVDPK